MSLKKWRMPWLDGKGGIAFLDILTCPICTQEKPIDNFTVREIEHMRRHVIRPQPNVCFQNRN